MKTWESRFLGWIGVWVQVAGALWWLFVAAWAVMIYGILTFLLPGAVPPGVNFYVIQPLLWLSLALLAWLGWRAGLKERPSPSKALLITAFLTGAFQVAVFILAGLWLGFVRSPYGHRPLVLLGNLVYAGTILVGMEMSRAYLMVAFGRRRPWLALALVGLLYSFLNIPFGMFRSLQSPLSAFPTVGAVVLPTLFQNLLATLLAFLGGPGASIAYRGTLAAFEWLSPLLPNVSWIVSTFLGILVPAFGFLVTHNRFAVQPESGDKAQPQQGQSTTAWLLVAAIAVALLGLNSGLFGVRPTLIASGSMTPILQVGDVVITRKIPPEHVQVNDIIRFREQGSVVIHRVVKIETQGSEITFITRGDANNTEDPPVLASALDGKVILTIPRIGWISIGIRQVIARIL